jgi:LPS export ABC transporter protein LptC
MSNSSSSLQSFLIRALIYGPLIAIAMVSLFYLYKYYHVTTLTMNASTAPNLMASDLDAWHFDVQGKPQYHLLSATATHYDKDNRTDFTKVTGYLYMPTEPFWLVKADTASATNGDEMVYLAGNVYLHQDAGRKNMTQTLTTDHLTVYPHKKIATTDAPITANRPDMVTTSQGAYLDLNNNSVKLHQAYTIYTPNNGS